MVGDVSRMVQTAAIFSAECKAEHRSERDLNAEKACPPRGRATSHARAAPEAIIASPLALQLDPYFDLIADYACFSLRRSFSIPEDLSVALSFVRW